MPTIDVGSLYQSSSPIRRQSYKISTMPVLSPHHSSSISGSYRSSYSSSLSTRPYFSTTSSYSTPRINTSSYSERFTTKTYSSDDGKRVYSRHGSITEDGITTRYRDREETREKNLRWDSLSRDSGYRDTRSNSILDSIHDRDPSLTRSETSSSRNMSSTLSVIETVADLRNKYSPANYVPSVLRKENISRSKSINDIGRPPIEKNNSEIVKIANSVAKKVIHENGVYNASSNSNKSVNFINNTNSKNDNNTSNNIINDDSNGNRPTVSEIRKKFDPIYSSNKKVPPSNGLIIEGTQIITNEATKIPTKQNNEPVLTIEERQNKKIETTELLGGNKYYSRPPVKCFKIISNNSANEKHEITSKNLQDEEHLTKTTEKFIDGQEKMMECQENSLENTLDLPKLHNHTTNIPSYIPNKDFYNNSTSSSSTSPAKSDEELQENNEIDPETKTTTVNNDISTSPRLNRTALTNQGSHSSPHTDNTSPPTIPRNVYNNAAQGNNITASNNVPNNYEGRNNSGQSIKNQGLNGLKNIGNTCFMNSVIQCLSNTKYLLEYVREEGYLQEINTSISSMKGALIKAFSQVIQELWTPDSTDKVVNTVALKSQIQRFAPRFMGYAQQDAQEFLRYLLEGLHEDVNRVVSKPKPILTEIDETLSDAQKASEAWHRYLRMDNSRVVDIFVGQLKSTLRCTHCGHCSVTFDPFWDLSLPIPQRQGQLRLGQCLEYFTREETLDGDEKPTCSKCKERRKCTKSFSIQKFPKILVIHLKRFSPTERFRGKLNLVIDFPLQGLDLSQFAANKGITDCVYNLYAISNHSGTTYSGHYTAYCKHPYSGQWHEYNDSRVSTISTKSIVSSEAYVLFYELLGQHTHI